MWGVRVFADPRFVRIALGLALAIALWYRAIQFLGFLSAPQWGYDFSAYWLAARHLIGGEAIYSAAQLVGTYTPQGQFLYLYPPFLAVLVVPLAWLSPESYGPGMALWAAGGALITLAVVVGIARLEGIARDPVAAAFLVAGAFAFPPLVAELALGNVHVLLLGLLAVAWWGIRRGGRAEAVAAVAVAVATLIKLFPVVVVLWFALTGRWRAVAWALGAMVGFAALTVPFSGIEPWLQYPRVLLNLGPPADLTDALAPAVWIPSAVPPLVARLLVVAAGLGLVVWAALRLEERASYGIAVAASILVAPALFHHYLAVMLLPLLLALRLALSGPPVARVALAASYLAMWPGQQPLLGAFSWVLNRALPTLGALGVPATLALWGERRAAGSGGPRSAAAGPQSAAAARQSTAE